MKNLKEVQSDRPREYPLSKLISLSKLAGLKVVDIEGYISRNFGEAMFQPTRIVFEDGRELWLNGEHDCAYIEDIADTNLINQEEIEALGEEQDKE